LNSPITTASNSAAQAPIYAPSAADARLPEGSSPEGKPSRKSQGTDWGRDPFQHPPEKVTSPHGGISNGATLVGIIGGKIGRVAIFGHSVLQKGDMVGNEMIVDIDQSHVTVTRDGFKRIIAMQEAR
jgi:hypothetical protein